jgi:copper(I)-binding protein
MRRRSLLALALFGLLSLLAVTARAEEGDAVAVSHVWARPSLAGAKNGAAYFTVTNHAGAAETLTGASTPVAEKAELHRDEMKNGVMTMRPAGPLALAPGETVTLAPGGLHLMLLGLKQPLKPGDRFPITLTFAHQQPITAEATVEASVPGAGHAMHH